MKVFITGKPGVGKTTLLKKVIRCENFHNVDGCIVEEIKNETSRLGFFIRYLLSNCQTLLASKTEHLSDFYLSKYSINLKGLEEELIPYMEKMIKNQNLDFIIFDEIGRMQNASSLFLSKLDCLLRKDCFIISTIVFDDEEWARKYKNTNFQMTLTEKNRDDCLNIIQYLINNNHAYHKYDLCKRNKLHITFNDLFKKCEYESIYNLFN